jgi:hypothetical protein
MTWSPGDGGGVVSAMRLAAGSRSCLIFGDDEVLGEETAGDCGVTELELSLRFSFLVGGWVLSIKGVVREVAGGERCEVDLELFGMWMPSSDSETDFRLVL